MSFLDAIAYIADQNLIHGDIKPGNILISNRDNRLRAFLGDFGLTGASGGTPIFAAPEGLNKASRMVRKTDLYSFAVMILFLTFPADLAIKLLFIPIEEKLKEFNESSTEFPLLHLIIKSLVPDPEDRADFEPWIFIIQEMKTFDKDRLRDKINAEILERTGVDVSPLNEALEKEAGLYYFILEHFGYDMRSGQLNENEAYQMSTAVSQMQKLSVSQSNIEIEPISKGIILLRFLKDNERF